MALIVQNDSGTITNANSYIDVAYADSYFTARNNVTWSAASTANKEAALVKAWQYIDTAFTFVGQIATDTQNTEFPRLYIYNSAGKELTGIDVKVKNAQCEYAVIALSQDLTINQTPSAQAPIKKEMNKADVVETEVEYDTSKGQPIVYSYPLGDFWLKDFLGGNTFNGYY
jgi:hypothetical protein